MRDSITAEEKTMEQSFSRRGREILRCRIVYPHFSGPDFCPAVRRINRYCEARIRAFRRYCGEVLYREAAARFREEGGAEPFEAILRCGIGLNADCMLSLFFDRCAYTGAERESRERFSGTWSLRSARRLRLGDCFIPGFQYGIYARNQVEDTIARSIQSCPEEYFHDYVDRVEATFREVNFYLTPRGVLLYFQQYDLAPYPSGITVFRISRTDPYVIWPGCR